jgi:hypothetical protein
MTQLTAAGPDQFDPATFTVVEPKAFEDLKVGDIFRAPTIHNQHGQLVLDGEHTYLLKAAQQSTSQATS